MPTDRANEQAEQLLSFVRTNSPVLALTGAGISSSSGLATYRDDQGAWKRAQPITAQAFLSDTNARQRYWARSFVGFREFNLAKPNASHQALVQFHHQGLLSGLVTQNVDTLHTRAGHPDVIELHGNIHAVRCTGCGKSIARTDYQASLLQTNPRLNELSGESAPDGDSDIVDRDNFNWLHAPACTDCDALMKPDVVFFGENVPRDRVEKVFTLLEQSKSLLVVGSSLMIYSGFRFARRASEDAKQLAILNLGTTRADALADLILNVDCETVLQALSTRL